MDLKMVADEAGGVAETDRRASSDMPMAREDDQPNPSGRGGGRTAGDQGIDHLIERRGVDVPGVAEGRMQGGRCPQRAVELGPTRLHLAHDDVESAGVDRERRVDLGDDEALGNTRAEPRMCRPWRVGWP